tara:strand:- start:113 stop:361 length:249 start_codon:yes stop_codon:yes gene_type:complete
MDDEKKLLKSIIISKAASGRYLNVNRTLRELRNLDDHYDSAKQTEDVTTMLKQFMTTTQDNQSTIIADAVEEAVAKALEDRE